MRELRHTKVYDANNDAWLGGARRALNEGGTASSKTWSILQLLVDIAQSSKHKILISIVSESLPHLKRGVIRDFFKILGEGQDNNPYYNKTEHVYSKPGWLGTIEFFGADEADKIRGPRRDILFINEGNNIPWETARGLDIRTAIFTIVDWNPVGEFWAHEHWVGKPGNAYIHSTYQDAKKVLPEAVIANIESYKDTDPNWWNVYGLGLIGKVIGLVYPYFEQIDTLPQGDYFYGLDFGFSNDKTALVKNVIVKGALYSQELIYEIGMTNQDIALRMSEIGIKENFDEILADSAEPKSIEEIFRLGFNIKGCPKGPGSVDYGHQKVRQYKHFWTKDSVNCIKEQRNFRYIEDKNGKFTEKTTHAFSNGMDARRYGVMGWVEEPEPEEAIIIHDSIQAEGLNMDL